MELTSLVGSDLVLLMLSAPTKVPQAAGKINGITRLEKLLYLATRESDLHERVQEPLEFVPYNYGPFSKGIYEAVDLLEDAGLVTEQRAMDGKTIDNAEEAGLDIGAAEYVERRFSLTPDGEMVAGLLAQEHRDVVRLLSAIKDRYAGLTLNQLVHYVYTRYPEDTVNSVIRDRHLPQSQR